MDVRWKWNIVRFLFTTLYLLAGWMLFTWSLVPFSLLMGAFFSLLTASFTYRIFIDEAEAGRRTLVPRLHYLVFYLLLLTYRMYISSFKVVYHVFRGDFNPRIVHFRTRLKTDIARVILTNSITLTPGTITLDLKDDHLIVHWLDAKTSHSRYAGDLVKGEFEHLLKKIWL